jgi:hypothetical protein
MIVVVWWKKRPTSHEDRNTFFFGSSLSLSLSLSLSGRFGNQDCEEEEEEEEEEVVFPPWTQARCREDFESEEKKNFVEFLFLFFFCSGMFVLLQSWETHDRKGRGEGKGKGREGKGREALMSS